MLAECTHTHVLTYSRLPIAPIHHMKSIQQGVADQSYKRGKAEKDLIVERMRERRSRRMAGAFVVCLKYDRWALRVSCGGRPELTHLPTIHQRSTGKSYDGDAASGSACAIS